MPAGTVSSHGFGVAEAIALARALDVLPSQCIVYAVGMADLTIGAAPSPEVTAALDDVVARVLAGAVMGIAALNPSYARSL